MSESLTTSEKSEFARLLAERDRRNRKKDPKFRDETRELSADLRAFIRAAWTVIEPATPFRDNWHIGVLSEHLEALTRREIRRLIITIPPRCMKSRTVAVFWPAWLWATNASTKILSASHSLGFSVRDCTTTRRLITSPWYQERWGREFQLTGDQNQKTWYENDKAGYRLGLSVNAGVTGHGGDVRILDDALDVKKADSKQIREETNRWIAGSWLDRVTDPKTSVDVVIMQRVHEMDPAGFLLRRGGWTHLSIPMEYEPKSQVNGHTFDDPREKAGDLLWPQRFGPDEVERIKADKGSYHWSGQYQQRPAPAEGGIFKRHWLARYKSEGGAMETEGGERVRPENCFRFITLDMARTIRELSDYTVMSVWAVWKSKPYRVYLLEVLRDRMEEPDIIPALRSLMAKWDVAYAVPEETGMEGTVQRMKREGLRVRPVKTERDKVTRARVAAPLMESGRVLFPESAPWLSDCELELLNFPKGDHDDFVDTLSLAVAHTEDEFRGGSFRPTRTAPATEYERERREVEKAKRRERRTMNRRIPDDGSPLDRFTRGR